MKSLIATLSLVALAIFPGVTVSSAAETPSFSPSGPCASQSSGMRYFKSGAMTTLQNCNSYSVSATINYGSVIALVPVPRTTGCRTIPPGGKIAFENFSGTIQGAAIHQYATGWSWC